MSWQFSDDNKDAIIESLKAEIDEKERKIAALENDIEVKTAEIRRLHAVIQQKGE